jgi:hypothetical protein
MARPENFALGSGSHHQPRCVALHVENMRSVKLLEVLDRCDVFGQLDFMCLLPFESVEAKPHLRSVARRDGLQISRRRSQARAQRSTREARQRSRPDDQGIASYGYGRQSFGCGQAQRNSRCSGTRWTQAGSRS